jgi:hypothetical protein
MREQAAEKVANDGQSDIVCLFEAELSVDAWFGRPRRSFRPSCRALVDGARELMARGFNPAALRTMRHADKAYDSFKPAPICEWAKWTYSESEEHPLKRQRWVPREVPLPVDREGQKLLVSTLAATHLPAGAEFASTA